MKISYYIYINFFCSLFFLAIFKKLVIDRNRKVILAECRPTLPFIVDRGVEFDEEIKKEFDTILKR